MSTLPNADIAAGIGDVRYWLKADIPGSAADVRYWGQSGHR
jgi:hypothetical protein